MPHFIKSLKMSQNEDDLMENLWKCYVNREILNDAIFELEEDFSRNTRLKELTKRMKKSIAEVFDALEFLGADQLREARRRLRKQQDESQLGSAKPDE